MADFNALKLMEIFYERLLGCSSTSGKINNFKAMEAIYFDYEEVREFWEYFPNEVRYVNKFKKITSTTVDDKFMNPDWDKINYSAPSFEGLYLLGETHFDPFTDEKFYWIKVGKSLNIKNRLKSYNTSNPMLFRIDYFQTPFKGITEATENFCHKKLKEISLTKHSHNEEWFLVDKDTYLEICSKGFKYFNILSWYERLELNSYI